MTTRKKLPPATDWQARDISDWNTTTFHAYLTDEHLRLFGCDYAPMGGWQAEKGMIGRLVGTRVKKGTADKALVKRFIDECFATYKPTKDWPGINFGFMLGFRKVEWQRLQAEANRKAQAEQKREEQVEDWEDIAEWL